MTAITSIQEFRSRITRKAPICQHCLAEATHESKTRIGNWTSLCQNHFRRFGSSEFRQIFSFAGSSAQAA